MAGDRGSAIPGVAGRFLGVAPLITAMARIVGRLMTVAPTSTEAVAVALAAAAAAPEVPITNRGQRVAAVSHPLLMPGAGVVTAVALGPMLGVTVMPRLLTGLRRRASTMPKKMQGPNFARKGYEAAIPGRRRPPMPRLMNMTRSGRGRRWRHG